MAELKHYKAKVYEILKEFEQARNNDGTLLAYFISKFQPHLITKDSDGEPAIKLKNLRNLPPIENLRRSRQIIQNDNGEFLPTLPEVRKARKIKEENFRQMEVREAKEQ